MEEYDREMKKLARRLLWLMLDSLGIREEEVPWAGGEVEEASAMFQLNWYPACPNPERAMGLAEHTDSPLFAILYQNRTSGLQVLGGDGRWATVPPLPGTLVVNVGDLLHILTNGRFKSVMHRAVVNRSRPRLSVAYFWSPPGDLRVSPLDKLLVGPDGDEHDQEGAGGPLYPPMSWSEYLKIKSQHFNQSLSLIRLRPLHPPPAAAAGAAIQAVIEGTATSDVDSNNSGSGTNNNKTTARMFDEGLLAT